MIAKIPMVMPSNESKVRNLFAFSELKANEKLSNINRIRSIVVIQFAVKLKLVFLIFGKTFDIKSRRNQVHTDLISNNEKTKEFLKI
jgi:uncharacterized membrane protein